MRRFVISDIHGSYDEMVSLFHHVNLDLRHDKLIVIGDMINRGPKSGHVLKELRNMKEEFPENIHITIGNHEEMMLEYCFGKSYMWLDFGGHETIQSINETFQKEGVNDLIRWVESLPLTYEDEKFVYAHAGIEYPYGENTEQDRMILWMTHQEFYHFDKDTLMHYTKNKPIVHGHTPVKLMMYDGARIAIDLGAQVVKEQKLGLAELEEMIYYEYDFNTKDIKKREIKHI